MKCLLTVLISFVLFFTANYAQLLTSDLETEQSEEEIANKTYVEEQSELQKFLFKNYNRKLRPLRNQSLPLQIGMHIYIMHYSVNQIEQTIALNGHIYMTWEDELAVWDPSSFNNVRSTIAKQWDLWQPDLRVANSVSGVNQYFEISKRSHTTLTSITSARTKVEVYPTFAVRIGCHFDYSGYPFDAQNCAMRLYTTQLMNEVELHIYYGLNPSVMLGWGEQAAKRHINDWELVSVRSNLSYYTSFSKANNKQFVSERPATAEETQYTWTLVLVWIELRRNAGLFWVELALPMAAGTLLNIGSFAAVRPEHALLVVLVNFFFQSVCLRDTAVRELPPVVGALPRIARYANALLVLTMAALGLHLWSLKFVGGAARKIPQKYLTHIRPLLNFATPRCDKRDYIGSSSSSSASAETCERVVCEGASVADTSEGYTQFGAPAAAANGASDDAEEKYATISAIVFRNLCAILYFFTVLCVSFVIFVI